MTKLYCAELLTIGSELLKGSTVNTNAAFLGRNLTALGFNCRLQTSCPDIEQEIMMKMDAALDRSDLIVLSGGLGPTPDDVTRDAVAHYFDVPLEFSEKQYSQIQRYYKSRHKKVPLIVRKEALFPKNSIPLVNRHGIALGFYVVHKKSLLVVLPGVPSELEKMYYELVEPLILKHFGKLPLKYSVIAKTVGISEPDVMRRLGKDFFDDPMEFGIYPGAGEVAVRIDASDSKIQKRLRSKISKRLSPWLYALCEKKLSEVVGELLTAKSRSVGCAESCTGGMLLAELTRYGGASRFVKGGVVAYANDVKTNLLGVRSRTMVQCGAVSKEAAYEMAQGVRKCLGADYGISITGVAGPSGGTKKKPIGKVFIGFASSNNVRVYEQDFWGDRGEVRTKSVMKALEILWRELQRRK